MSRHKHKPAAVKPDHDWAVSTGEAIAFFEGAVGEPALRADGAGPWMLDVGAGQGRIAAALAERGWRIRAVEPDAEAAAVIRARDPRIQVYELDAVTDEGTSRAGALAVKRGFDAALFSRSLHHVADLARALGFAHALLAKGAPLVLEEFAWDRAELATAAWFFRRWDMGVAAGRLLRRETDEGPEEFPDPLVRWRHTFEHDPPLHTGDAMISALQALPGMDAAVVEESPGLYRFFEQRSTRPDPDWIRALLEEERSGIAAGTIRAVGLRAVARKT